LRLAGFAGPGRKRNLRLAGFAGPGHGGQLRGPFTPEIPA